MIDSSKRDPRQRTASKPPAQPLAILGHVLTSMPATLTLCLAVLSVTLTYPFNNDNALYAYMADLMLRGNLPYLGSWDQNFPAILLIHAPQILLFGKSQLAFHVWDIAIQLAGSFLLYRAGVRLHSRVAGFLGAVLSALYYVQQGLWMAGERDTYVSILLVGVFLLLLSDRRPFWAGVLLGATFLFRPTYGLYAPVAFLFLLLAPDSDSAGRRRLAMLFVLGWILPVLLLVGFYAANGGLADLYEATILFNLRVYGRAGEVFNFWEPIRFYTISLPAVCFAIYVLIRKSIPQRGGARVVTLWFGFFAASVLSLILLYRHSVYHYHPAMTLFILMSAVGWSALQEMMGQRSRARWLAEVIPITVVLFFTLQTFRGNTSQLVLRGITSGTVATLSEAYGYYEGSPEFGEAVQRNVGEYLKARTEIGEPVQMFGPYSYPQYYASLGTASRFQTLHALAMRAPEHPLQNFQVAWRAEYLEAIASKRPRYFIVCDAPEAFRQYYSGRLGHEILRDDWRELGRFIETHYHADTSIGAFTIYARSN